MPQSVTDDKGRWVARKSKDAKSEQRDEGKSGDSPGMAFQCTLHRSHAMDVWESIEHAQHQHDRIHNTPSPSCAADDSHYGELTLQQAESETWEATDKPAKRLRLPASPSRQNGCHTNLTP